MVTLAVTEGQRSGQLAATISLRPSHGADRRALTRTHAWVRGERVCVLLRGGGWGGYADVAR
jgi:hypothetical protein